MSEIVIPTTQEVLDTVRERFPEGISEDDKNEIIERISPLADCALAILTLHQAYKNREDRDEINRLIEVCRTRQDEVRETLELGLLFRELSPKLMPVLTGALNVITNPLDSGL